MSRNRYNITPEQFIQAWETSESAAEAAQKLGMPREIVSARAHAYRQMGIRLKKMERPTKSNKLDVDSLNQLIQNIESELPEARRVATRLQPRHAPLPPDDGTVDREIESVVREARHPRPARKKKGV